MRFTLAQMIECLTKIGYTVVEEKEVVDESYYHNQTREVTHNVYNVYKNGEKLTDFMKVYGTKRVELVFSIELEKRLINLF